ncbi:MAG: MarR family transcriptional regulator [Bacilli bacterium]|jgi:DNA-binding MarR family transcriptional regulator|nr:MarR family transcriptional regulator [Bacilli bacterium]
MENEEEEDKIGREVFKTFWMMKTRFNYLFSDIGIQGTQGRIMSLVYSGKALTPISIAQQMRLTRATVTEHLNELEKRGYILKTPSKTDKRSKVIRLAPKGKKAEEEILKKIAVFEEELSALFTPEELKQFGNFLSRISDYYISNETTLRRDY